jgi:hypothetical protein
LTEIDTAAVDRFLAALVDMPEMFGYTITASHSTTGGTGTRKKLDDKLQAPWLVRRARFLACIHFRRSLQRGFL